MVARRTQAVGMKHKWDQAGGHWQCFLLSTLTLHFAHQHISRNSAIGPFLYMYSRTEIRSKLPARSSTCHPSASQAQPLNARCNAKPGCWAKPQPLHMLPVSSACSFSGEFSTPHLARQDITMKEKGTSATRALTGCAVGPHREARLPDSPASLQQLAAHDVTCTCFQSSSERRC